MRPAVIGSLPLGRALRLPTHSILRNDDRIEHFFGQVKIIVRLGLGANMVIEVS